MKTNWFMVVSLILLGVIIGYSISTFWLNQPNILQSAEPICTAWVKSLIEAGYLQVVR